MSAIQNLKSQKFSRCSQKFYLNVIKLQLCYCVYIDSNQIPVTGVTRHMNRFSLTAHVEHVERLL